MSRRPSSPPAASASSSRNPSIISQAQQHAPLTPSGLRESHTLARSPEEMREEESILGGRREATHSSEPSPNSKPTHLDEDPSADEDLDGKQSGLADLGHRAATETTALLKKPFEFIVGTPAHDGSYNHGTFSPRLESRAESIRSGNSGGFGGSPPRGSYSRQGSGVFGNLFPPRRPTKKMSTTSYLAERHGITNTTMMYVLPNSLCRAIC